MSEPSASPAARPRLYHAPSSYYSMIARLALAEGGVEYDRVFVDIHRLASQQSPDYVRLNPNMTVPTLVLSERIIDQSRAIAEFAMAGGATLDDEVGAWLDLHYGYPIEELTFGGLLARNPLARIIVPRLLRRARRRLLAYAAANRDLAAVYEARAAVFADRERTFDPAAAQDLAERRRVEAMAMMDRLEVTLSDGRATLIPSGYGIADVVFTVFLGRMKFVGLDGEISRRPALQRYWRAMQSRPSFVAADIWTSFHAARFIRGLAGLVTA